MPPFSAPTTRFQTGWSNRAVQNRATTAVGGAVSLQIRYNNVPSLFELLCGHIPNDIPCETNYKLLYCCLFEPFFPPAGLESEIGQGVNGKLLHRTCTPPPLLALLPRVGFHDITTWSSGLQRTPRHASLHSFSIQQQHV